MFIPFCDASGEKVSNSKSQFFFPSINAYEYVANAIDQELDIPITNDLGGYLGMPKISGRVTRNTFQYVLDRVDKRLAGWRVRTLLLVGRAISIQSTLSTVSLNTMQLAKLAHSLCDDSDLKVRIFLWDGDFIT